LVGKKKPKPHRYVIDFSGMSLFEAEAFTALFKPVKGKVLPAREAAAKKEADRNKAALGKNPSAKVNKHHANFLATWWELSYPRPNMLKALKKLKRYIVCGQVTKRPIFAFVSTLVRPNAALQVFAYDDDYSFGILQSSVHWRWFTARCSTMKSDPRYTSNTVWDSFPWPQEPTKKAIRGVADAAVEFRNVRDLLAYKHNRSYRELYRLLELPGDNQLKDAQEALDKAVRTAYGMKAHSDDLSFLLALNAELAEAESSGEAIIAGGLPASISDRASFVTNDGITP
jgi:hypothetical protein